MMSEYINSLKSDRYIQKSFFDKFRASPAGNVVLVFLLVLLTCSIVSLLYPDNFRFYGLSWHLSHTSSLFALEPYSQPLFH